MRPDQQPGPVPPDSPQIPPPPDQPGQPGDPRPGNPEIPQIPGPEVVPPSIPEKPDIPPAPHNKEQQTKDQEKFATGSDKEQRDLVIEHPDKHHKEGVPQN